MRTLARIVAIFLILLMIVAQLVTLGHKEGWDAVAFGVGFIALLVASVWYGFLAED